MDKTHPSGEATLIQTLGSQNYNQNVLSQTGFHSQEAGAGGAGDGHCRPKSQSLPCRHSAAASVHMYHPCGICECPLEQRGLADLPFMVCRELGIPYVIGCKSKRFMWTSMYLNKTFPSTVADLTLTFILQYETDDNFGSEYFFYIYTYICIYIYIYLKHLSGLCVWLS